jgi:hypothetical protein
MCQYNPQAMPRDGVGSSFDESRIQRFQLFTARPSPPQIAHPCTEDERGFASPTRDRRFLESASVGHLLDHPSFPEADTTMAGRFGCCGWKAILRRGLEFVSKVATAHPRRAANAASTLGMTNHPMPSPIASSSLAVLDETCRNWASQIKCTMSIEGSMRPATP